MGRVAIVNTGLCNLDSIARAIEECGSSPTVTDEPSDLGQASHIVLPGVGAFPEAMRRLRARGLVDEMTEQVIGKQIPFLGVCLGMQLMGTVGMESEETQGLAWIDGSVTPLDPTGGDRVPHIGWNSVELVRETPLFRDIDPKRDFYFVHSYALRPSLAETVTAVTSYAGSFVSAISTGNMHGVQFHPEKSQQAGFAVLRNFLAL